MGDDSGTGVAFTRDPNTGEKVLFGEYLTNAQGEDVVAGIRTPQHDRPACSDEMPEVYAAVRARSPSGSSTTTATCRTSSSPSSAASCTCSRRARPSAPRAAAVKIAVDMVDEGIITARRGARARRAGPGRPAPARPVRPRPPRPSADAAIATGLNASPGRRRRQGRLRRRPRRASWRSRARRSSWSGSRPSPDDVHGMLAAQGVLTARGGATSHAAVVARQIGKPCVAGCAALIIDYASASLPASNGARRHGRRVDQPRRHDRRGLRRRAAHDRGPLRDEQADLRRSSSWADEVRRLAGLGQRRQPERRRPGPRATARRASACAAPSTCSSRSERLPHRARRMILVAFQATRAKRRRDAGETLDADDDDGRRHASTPRWPSSRSSRRMTSRASSRPWTACRSSSA